MLSPRNKKGGDGSGETNVGGINCIKTKIEEVDGELICDGSNNATSVSNNGSIR